MNEDLVKELIKDQIDAYPIDPKYRTDECIRLMEMFALYGYHIGRDYSHKKLKENDYSSKKQNRKH